MYQNMYGGFNMPQFSNYGSPTPSTNIIYVSGLEEVKLKPQAFNSTMFYRDNEKKFLYEKRVDGTGRYEIEMYKLSEYKPDEQINEQCAIDLSQYVKTVDLDALKSEINDIKNKLNMSVGE